MKRKVKNIVMVIILLITIILTGVTIYNAKESTSIKKDNIKITNKNQNDRKNNEERPTRKDSNTQNQNENKKGNNNKKSSKNEQNATGEKSNNSSKENTEVTKTKEDNTENNEIPEKPEGEKGMGEPPEKPEGEEGMGEPPEKPEGEEGEMEEPPALPEGEMEGMPSKDSNTKKSNSESKLSSKYYVLFTVEGLVISTLASYLVLSKFNKKTLKETFENKNKIIICAISTILLTGAVVATSTLITNKISSTSNETTAKNNNQREDNMGKDKDISYNAKEEITSKKTIEDKNYESSEADENALSVSGDIEVTASNIKVTKTGDSDGGDNTSFYGTNSAIIAKDGANLTIKNATITTDATGANGVFSYGGSATTNNSKSDGTTISISDSKITTTKGNSGGIMTTGGGTTNAKNLTIITSGQSSAAIRSDRGGGTVNVDGGTYKTSGVGSPAIYSTADITVKNAELISTTSEGVIIEGKNKITLENVKLTDTHTKNVKSKTYKNIFIYQSMSGDAAEGEATFTSKNSTITTNKGDSIYVSNTKAVINLTNNKFINNDKDGYFLRIQADSWGKEGSNGGEVTLNLNNQIIDGNIGVDSISTLEMNFSSSEFKGTIGSKDSKEIKIVLDKASKITLTGDSYITSLENADTSNSNINFNGYKLYVNGKAIN